MLTIKRLVCWTLIAVAMLPAGDLRSAAADPPSPALESWEISKRYDAGILRFWFARSRRLPESITVPAVRGHVLDPAGKPVEGAVLLSHSPRQPIDMRQDLTHYATTTWAPSTRTDAEGAFSLPKRYEPYRVLVTHPTGVASASHEELLRGDGTIKLLKWATVTGTLVVNGKPLAGEHIRLHGNTLPWSFSRLGSRLQMYWNATTDEQGRFAFRNVPPFEGNAYHNPKTSGLSRGTRYVCKSGENTHIELGRGRTVTGSLAAPGAKLKVLFAQRRTLPMPYPTDLAADDEQGRYDFRYKTVAGQRVDDINYQRYNSNFHAEVAADGRFVIYGLPADDWTLTAYFEKPHPMLKHEFSITEAEGEPIDLGIVGRQGAFDPLSRDRRPAIPEKN